MASYEALKEESSQIILYNIHTDQPVAEEGDAFRLLGTEADGRMMGGILGKTHREFLVSLVFVPRADIQFHVYFSAADAA